MISSGLREVMWSLDMNSLSVARGLAGKMTGDVAGSVVTACDWIFPSIPGMGSSSSTCRHLSLGAKGDVLTCYMLSTL